MEASTSSGAMQRGNARSAFAATDALLHRQERKHPHLQRAIRNMADKEKFRAWKRWSSSLLNARWQWKKHLNVFGEILHRGWQLEARRRQQGLRTMSLKELSLAREAETEAASSWCWCGRVFAPELPCRKAEQGERHSAAWREMSIALISEARK